MTLFLTLFKKLLPPPPLPPFEHLVEQGGNLFCRKDDNMVDCWSSDRVLYMSCTHSPHKILWQKDGLLKLANLLKLEDKGASTAPQLIFWAFSISFSLYCIFSVFHLQSNNVNLKFITISYVLRKKVKVIFDID